jgi:hypothetical protein
MYNYLGTKSVMVSGYSNVVGNRAFSPSVWMKGLLPPMQVFNLQSSSQTQGSKSSPSHFYKNSFD